MKNIFRNLKKYWYFVLLILVLLVGQAYCELSLPDYTSNLIDVGISNSGIEHCVPEYISQAGYQKVAVFLEEAKLADWEQAYELNEEAGYYQLADTGEENWTKVDDEFSKIIAIVYMLTSQQGNTDMTEQMATQMTAQMATQVVAQMEEKLDSLGDSMIRSMAKAFARQEYEACDVDLDQMQTDYLWSTGGKMLVMALLMAIAAIVVGFLASIAAAGVGRDLRNNIFKKVMGFSNAELDRFSTASLITRSTNDVQQIQMVTVMILRMVLYAPILAIGGIFNIRNYHSGMNWVIVLAVAAVLCLILALMLIAMPKFKIMQTLVDKVNLVAREILTGIPVIRAFGREKKEEERFDEANERLTRVMIFTNRTMSCMMPVLMVLMNGVSVLIVWVGGHKIDDGVLEVGAMTAFLTYAMVIIMGFLMLTMVSIMLPRAGVAADRIQEVLDTEMRITDKADAKAANGDGTVVFNHVSFRYPDGEENVLSDIDFIAKPGQTTAIIGSTGCGKSTLVKLIPRFFDVTEGAITIGGTDVRDLQVDSLRSEIGYVPQKAILFSGDIRSNIVFGAPNATEADMKEAAAIAQATDFIEEKKEQYASAIAQGGTNVSGGQKQRLSIARAIARHPKIYIFDDSFSALDFKTDTTLRAALAKKTKDATVLIVAQRVSTILNADQIIVLENGEMIGKGTHRKLVESCEEYKLIAQSQMSETEFLASIGKEGR
jgi:ATP-binding cassette subfamily B protein